MVDLTPSFVQISCITFDANWGPQSEITWWGRPVHCHTPSRYNLAVPSAVIVLWQGKKIAALLKQSTTTKRELNPWESRRSIMKSMVMTPQMSVGTWLGFKGTWVLGHTLVDLQVAHLSI